MLTRREFLRVSALAGAGTLAAACAAPPATEPAPAPVEPAVAPEVPTTAPAEPTAAPASPAEEPSRFSEAPMLAEKVAAGELPPVDERLPENPFVITGLDGIGNYGGGWRLNKRGQADTGSPGQVLSRGLLEINQDMQEYARLAEAWEVSEDGTAWTFHLRRGVRWSDGTPMTAEDYRFWYEDLILNRDYTVAQPEYLSSVIEGERVPATFSAPDDFTVQWLFERPAALFHYNLVNDLGQAAPAHYLKQFHIDYADADELSAIIAGNDSWDDWTQVLSDRNSIHLNPERPTHHPWVPTNPFADEVVIYERNPYFWSVDGEGNQLPYIDKLMFREAGDIQVAILRVVNGEVDCQARHHFDFGNYTVFKESESLGDYTVQIWRGTRVYTMHFNMTTKNERLRELFMERDFRVAMSHAVDRDEMRELLMDGFATNMQYCPPADSPYYYEKLANAYLQHDPDRANELLDGLGYTERDGEGYRLFTDGSGDRLSITALGQDATGTPAMLMLVDYFRDVGIQLNYRGMDRALLIETHQSNEVEMTAGDADRNMIPLAAPRNWIKTTGLNDRAWCNAWTAWYEDRTHPTAEEPPEGHWIWDIWAAWEQIQQTVDEEQQKELFWQILDIWAEELPSVGLYGDVPILIPVKNGFKGIQEGYGWDCCSTDYEHCIDNGTWYWEDPENHTF